MGPVPSYWRTFEPDLYLDLRRPEWVEEEEQRWVRYSVCEQGGFVYIHALHANRIVEAIGLPNVARGASRCATSSVSP